MDINTKKPPFSRFNRCQCGAEKLRWHVACPPCWAKVPRALQTEVYRLKKERPKSDEHRAAVRRAMETITGQKELF